MRSGTGELRDCGGRRRHPPAVVASGAGLNRTATLAQSKPLIVPVDEDTALIDDTLQEQRRIGLDPAEGSDVHATPAHALKVGTEIYCRDITGKRHTQIEIRIRILVATSHRAVENRQPNSPLGAKSAT